jgi:single-stranded DNA-binding protein
VAEHVTKGQRLIVEGELEREEYRDSDNNVRSRQRITADKMGHALPYLKWGDDTENVSTDH